MMKMPLGYAVALSQIANSISQIANNRGCAATMEGGAPIEPMPTVVELSDEDIDEMRMAIDNLTCILDNDAGNGGRHFNPETGEPE